ncbi:WbqC-like protein family [Proteiniphilum saccharofermentans]|uniref:WbqC-like protein family n=1 Tax=Proteiniphilum saccharofermentans TaxID=1642647 RepID=A0A1R3T0S1_9BACT|nr:WbqC family protein [Proteiniphilum saccharofermentans]SCD21341.1 WbqC-like protein family [Proteiniphilum saccharofermentans]
MIFLPSFYLAPVEYYAALFHAENAIIEIQDNYRKQSYRNRCIIGGANGPLALSIPVEKPEKGKSRMKDIRIAEHGDWRHLHWNAIVSAYNSTPFFQYFEEDFRSFYEKKYRFLHDFNESLRLLVCGFIGIETPCSYTPEYVKETSPNTIDLREAIDPKRPSSYETQAYYQVFAEKWGFIPNLSIIDMLFNLGNETRLYLIKYPYIPDNLPKITNS